MNSSSIVRRTDLSFRGHYPDIETCIYKIGENRFSIYCNCDDARLRELTSVFEYSIRPVTAPVGLVNKIPQGANEIIPPIGDKEISKNFEGLTMSQIDILNLLVGKFPDVHFDRIEVLEGNEIRVYTGAFSERINGNVHYRFLSIHNEEKIQRFLEALKMPFRFSIKDVEVEKKPDLPGKILHNPIQYMYSSRFSRGRVPEFSERDEALWYDNIDRIFAGNFVKDDLFFHNSKEYTCYADFSGFSNIDIRNFLFLFQCAYLTPPFEKNLGQWLVEQKISEDEFFQLVQKGRIKLVLVQPEFRYDLDFIERVYKINANAVITRRAIHALIQADIVSLSDNYIFKDSDIISNMRKFSTDAGRIANVPSNYLFDVMTWPIQARRKSFEYLQYGSPFSVGAFGINNAVEKSYSKILNRDLSFEFTISAPAIHIANALNATYFPVIAEGRFSDYVFASVMGEMLNLYKNFSIAGVKDYIEGKEKFANGVLPISPIEIVELNDYISITELEQILNYHSISPGSKRLMETLSGLDVDSRKNKIILYNQAIKKQQNSKLSAGTIDLAENVALDSVALVSGLNILGSLWSMFKIGKNKLTNVMSPVLDKLDEAIHSHDTEDQANIHYLSKINRVAKLRDRSESPR